MVRRRDVLTASDLAKAGDKSFTGADGVRLKVEFVKVVGTNSINVQFAVSAPEGYVLDPKNLELRVTDAKGVEHRPNIVILNPVLRLIRVPEAEDLVWLSGSPQGAFPAQIQWAALAPGSPQLNRREWSGNAQFSTTGPIGAPAKHTLFRFERLRTELPFEYRNLPLP